LEEALDLSSDRLLMMMMMMMKKKKKKKKKKIKTTRFDLVGSWLGLHVK
jgi:hypothetical protein